jgi:hypothetical protein
LGIFRKAGLYPDSGTKLFRLRFDGEMLREYLGFRELRERNGSIDGLSRHRKQQPFGIINE